MWKLSFIIVIFSFIWFYLNSSRERSLTLQVIKYFSRADGGVPNEDIASNAAWYGPDMWKRQDEWLIHLSEEEVNEFRVAVSASVATNKTLNLLTKEDFPLNSLAGNISVWRRSLSPEHGIGVVVLRGLPVNIWTRVEQEILWWGIGLHLGIPGAQNGNGDLLGHVSDEFFGESNDSSALGNVRQYRTSEKIEFHCDVADVVGLLCLQTAGQGGGRSRIASSVTVFNELRKQHPEMIKMLFESVPLDARGDAGINWFPVTPCAYNRGVLKTFWHTEYFRTAYRYADSPVASLPTLMGKLIDAYDAIANDPNIYLEMEFREGDIQLISNHVVRFCYATLIRVPHVML